MPSAAVAWPEGEKNANVRGRTMLPPIEISDGSNSNEASPISIVTADVDLWGLVLDQLDIMTASIASAACSTHHALLRLRPQVDHLSINTNATYTSQGLFIMEVIRRWSRPHLAALLLPPIL